MITEKMMDIEFNEVKLGPISFGVGEGKAGDLEFNGVYINLQGCTLSQVLSWVPSGQSLRVKLQGIVRDMERKAALVLKKSWETEGVNLKYIVPGKRGKGKSVVDPTILLAQMTPAQRKALFAKYPESQE